MRRTYARPVTPSEQVWGCFESSAATTPRSVHGTHVCGTGQISPGIIVAVVTTACAYLDRLLRVTVVHLPFVPAQEATNLHHGSSVLLPDSSLQHQAVNIHRLMRRHLQSRGCRSETGKWKWRSNGHTNSRPPTP